MDISQNIRRVFDIEIQGLTKVRDSVLESMVPIVELLAGCKGKVVLCGMGKPGFIGKKISATMSSLGLPSFFLHPAEGLHGDLGKLSSNDIIIIISNSGESIEVCNLLPNIRMIGTTIIGITSIENSTLAKYLDYLILIPKLDEACIHELAPTSSTTAELVIGDALAVAVSEYKNFRKEDYALFHPGGALGKKLVTKVIDIMHAGDANAVVLHTCPLTEAINTMTEKGLGAVCVTESKGNLCGIITDGDLRRALNRRLDIYSCYASDVMTKAPIFTTPDVLAVEALKIIESRKISVLPVVNEQTEPIGMVQNHDIIAQGIFL